MSALLSQKLKPRKPLGDEVYDAVKKAVLRGELRPGQRLIEEQLAESLGASRTPVRQAIHMLEREGLAERLQRGGFAVRALSLKDAEEILDLRVVLESYAARRAAENSSAADIDGLENLNEAFGRAVGEGRVARLAELNTDFHEALYGLAGNRRLRRSIADLHDHFYRYRVALLQLRNMAETSYQDHREMIAAMKVQDADLTEKLVRRHIFKGKDIVLREVQAGLLDA